MAKKTRTPPPPRRPGHTPGRRATPGAARPQLDERRRKQIYWGLAAVGLATVVAIVLAVTVGGGKSAANDKSVVKALAAAHCTFQSVNPLPPTHPKSQSGYHADSPTLTSKVKWATDPPSGGGHYPLWAVWNFYTEPVNPRRAVHNEEHGGVVIWWGTKVPKSEVDRLAIFYQSSPDGMLGTPYPKLGDKIALTAWTGDSTRYNRNGYYGVGKLAICPAFDEQAFKTFRDAYRGKGPEGIPLSADQPGTGPSG